MTGECGMGAGHFGLDRVLELNPNPDSEFNSIHFGVEIKKK